MSNQPSPAEMRFNELAFVTALDAAIGASELMMPYWPNTLNDRFDSTRTNDVTDTKDGVGNFSTLADTASEEFIIQRILGVSDFAGSAIIAEESGSQNTSSDVKWIIDPIDGTINFSQGLEDFGVSIGLVVDNVPTVGVIAVPAKGIVIASLKGHGVRLYDMKERLINYVPAVDALEAEKPLDKSLISYDVAYKNRASQLARLVMPISEKVRYMHSWCSSSVSCVRVAMGQADAFFSEEATIMDLGAASAIIQEVGGVATTMDGSLFDWSKGKQSFVASRNAGTHDKLLAFFTANT